MAKTRRVILTGRLLAEAYIGVSKAIGTNTRERKCLDIADEQMKAAGKIEHRLDGSWSLGVAEDVPGEAIFSEECIFGVKVGLVQLITGASLGKPASTGNIKYTLLPTAKAFGIEKLVRKEAKIDDDDGELDELEIEFDDAVKPEATGPKGLVPAPAEETAKK